MQIILGINIFRYPPANNHYLYVWPTDPVQFTNFAYYSKKLLAYDGIIYRSVVEPSPCCSYLFGVFTCLTVFWHPTRNTDRCPLTEK